LPCHCQWDAQLGDNLKVLLLSQTSISAAADCPSTALRKRVTAA
jgi:hypothetical protein